MANFINNPKFQFFDNNGLPLSGGLVYTYVVNTLTPTPTYPTTAAAIAGTGANANPVVLDSRGEAPIVVNSAIKIIVKDSAGNQLSAVDNFGSAAGGAATESLVDSNGNELITFTETVSAVNQMDVTNAASGAGPIIQSAGNNTNIDFNIKGKGTGTLKLDGGTTGGVTIGSASSGTISLQSNTAITGTFSVSGTSTLTGAVSAGAGVAVTGNITASGSITATGAMSCASLTVGGTATAGVPAGTILDYGGTTPPTGYLNCDGSAISRTTYATLFGIISTNFGTGDGSTTFNLPNFRRRVAVGSGGSGSGTLAATVGSTNAADETFTITAEYLPPFPTTTGTMTTHALSANGNPGGGVPASVNTSWTNGGTTDGTPDAISVYGPSLVVYKIIKT